MDMIIMCIHVKYLSVFPLLTSPIFLFSLSPHSPLMHPRPPCAHVSLSHISSFFLPLSTFPLMSIHFLSSFTSSTKPLNISYPSTPHLHLLLRNNIFHSPLPYPYLLTSPPTSDSSYLSLSIGSSLLPSSTPPPLPYPSILHLFSSPSPFPLSLYLMMLS